MAKLTTIDETYSTNHAVTDSFAELERKIDDHINQELSQDGYHEEIGRQLRIQINKHSADRCREMEKNEELRIETEISQFEQRQREIESIMKRATFEIQQDTFTHRNIACAAVTTGIGGLYLVGGIALWLALTGLAIIAGLFVHNLVAYATRNRKKR